MNERLAGRVKYHIAVFHENASGFIVIFKQLLLLRIKVLFRKQAVFDFYQ